MIPVAQIIDVLPATSIILDICKHSQRHGLRLNFFVSENGKYFIIKHPALQIMIFESTSLELLYQQSQSTHVEEIKNIKKVLAVIRNIYSPNDLFDKQERSVHIRTVLDWIGLSKN